MSDPKQDAEHGQSPENAIIAARRERAAGVREKGENPFDNRVPALDRVVTVLVAHESARAEGGKYDAAKVDAIEKRTYRLGGRIVAARSFGKAAFLRLRDRSGEIQLFCRTDALGADFERLHAAGGAIDAGDFVVVEGSPMVTKTGELSIEARSIKLLTKAYRPLPEKWHGLQDVELRYRQRYVDLVANPDVAEVFQARAYIVRALRRFLDDDGFLEVETP